MRRIILTSFTVALVVGLALAPLASAQQAPPSWKQGQPSELANSPLAPHAQPPAPKAPGEILVDKIKLPTGFKASLWAHGLNNARMMTWGDKGTLFVSSRVAGNVYAVVDKGGQREVKTIAKGLNLPNGVAFKDGTLYIAEVSRITKMTGIEDKLDNPPAAEVVYDILPRDLPHGWKHLAFGPDGKLYFNIGAPCNICMPPDTHANISRVNPDGTGFEYVAHGIRNSVGFDWHPVTKELHFTTGSMFPPEYKNRALLAQRGSWNRTQKVGFRVMMVTLGTGAAPKYEVFAEGWLQGDQVWGRPVYTQEMKDGSLLVSDDYAGAIYRITYQR